MSLVVKTAKKGRGARVGFAAGLRWAVLDDGQKSSRKQSLRQRIRGQATAIGANRYTTAKAGIATYVGLYSEPLSSKHAASQLMSLAMLMREIASEGNNESEVSVALLMQPEGLPEKRVLIVILDGFVAVDAVLERQRAIDELMLHINSTTDMIVLSEHPEITHAHRLVTWDEITSTYFSLRSKKSHLLKSIPYSWTSLALMTILVLGLLAATAYHQLVRVPEAKRLKAMQSANIDQTPAYQSEAFASIAKDGWNRSTLVSFFKDQILTQPYLLAGWTLQAVACSASKCNLTWIRQGGNSEELAIALPKQSIDVAASALDRTVTAFALQPEAVAFNKGAIKKMDESLSALRPVLQKMANAGVTSTMSEPKRWAVIDISNVREEALLATIDLELNFPPHQLSEVLDLLPASVVPQTFRLSIGSGDAKNQLRLVLKGKMYVAQI
jgi:hypothetical protein